MRFTLCFLLIAAAARAEFLVIDMTVLGMDCVSCVTGLTTKLKRLRGVETVAVLPEKNLVSLKLAVGNRIGIDRVRDDIKAVGFNPRDAVVTVTGSAALADGRMMFTPQGSTVEFQLTGHALEPAEQITLQARQPLPASPQAVPVLDVISAKRD